jgi:hypothetical protein
MHARNSVKVIDPCSKSSKYLSQLCKLAGNVLQCFAEHHDRMRVTATAASPGRLRPQSHTTEAALLGRVHPQAARHGRCHICTARLVAASRVTRFELFL